jgi:hypothetical protein
VTPTPPADGQQDPIELAAYNGALRASTKVAEQLAVVFLDLLFAFSLTAVFTTIATNPSKLVPTQWAQLVVTTWLVTLSWFGFHWERRAHPMDVAHVWDWGFWQTMIDVGILALYFVLAEYAARGPRPGQTLESMARIIFIIFGCYLAWDLLQLLVSDNEERRTSLIITSSFVGLMALAWVVIYVQNPTGSRAIIVWWGVYAVLLFVYRLLLGYCNDAKAPRRGLNA